MKILTANSVPDLLVKGGLETGGKSIADALGMKYIGKFASG